MAMRHIIGFAGIRGRTGNFRTTVEDLFGMLQKYFGFFLKKP